MRKQMERVSLDAGNWIAWLAVAAILSFCAGWIARAMDGWTFCAFPVA